MLCTNFAYFTNIDETLDFVRDVFDAPSTYAFAMEEVHRLIRRVNPSLSDPDS